MSTETGEQINDPEYYKEFLQKQKDYRAAYIADLKSKVAESSDPASDEIISKTSNIFISDFIEVMRGHPGFRLEDKIRSLKTTFVLFDSAYKDIQRALDEFDIFSRSGEFGFRTAQARHDKIEVKIRKELYCFSSLAHSLQDHCRRLKAEWQPMGFDIKIQECFKDDGLHDFVCGLRTAMHHLSMVEADFLLRNIDREMTSHYVLKKDELLAIDKAWSIRARRSLNRMVDQIDVRVFSTEYSRRASRFYNWLLAKIDDEPPAAVRDYRRYWKEFEKVSAQTHWNLMLDVYSKLKEKIDPYDYLHEYLHTEELEEAMKFPKHSKEQIDFIIGIVDINSACTDQIRRAAYRLFGVSNGQ